MSDFEVVMCLGYALLFGTGVALLFVDWQEPKQ